MFSMGEITEMELSILVNVGTLVFAAVGAALSYFKALSTIRGELSKTREEIAKKLVIRTEIIQLIETHAPVHKIFADVDLIKERMHQLEKIQLQLQTEINVKLDFLTRGNALPER